MDKKRTILIAGVSFNYAFEVCYPDWERAQGRMTVACLRKSGKAGQIYTGASIRHPGEDNCSDIGRKWAFVRAATQAILGECSDVVQAIFEDQHAEGKPENTQKIARRLAWTAWQDLQKASEQ